MVHGMKAEEVCEYVNEYLELQEYDAGRE